MQVDVAKDTRVDPKTVYKRNAKAGPSRGLGSRTASTDYATW
jgi:hypothetical protein